MIDLHAHPLPGVDDGPATLDEALALARATVAAGVEILCATPHIEHRLMVDPFEVAERTAALQAELDSEGIALHLAAAGELAPPRAAELSDAELRAVAFRDSDWLLLECPLQPVDLSLEPVAVELMDRGFRIVLAHPERSPLFLREPGRLLPLVERGAVCSVTASALTGRFGSPSRGLALKLVEDGLAHDIASDAHDAERRPPGMREPLEAAETQLRGLGALVSWLTAEVPGAILAGEDPPPRPDVKLRRGGRARFRRA